MSSLSLPNIYRTLSRKKPVEDTTESKLAKVLSTFDLTALGIGSTLGVGVYVLAGEVSKTVAGPAVVISFLIAAIASIFAGLCYAEFGARVPKAGSAYIYSYVTIGEFVAFIIGWNLIMEYAIGSASVVKGISNYLDSRTDNAMKNFLLTYLPMNVAGLAGYADVFAFAVTLIFSWAIALGAKESTKLNNVFTMLNLGVVLFVIIAGMFKVSARNWALPKEEIPPNFGEGGFMPYGFAGVIRGAASCFYGFIGFDCIATAGEEAKNPKKSIPLAVITSLAMIFLAYFGVSTVLTMMLPYYDQDQDAPLPHIFKHYGWYIAENIVSYGAVFGLCCSLMGAMFPLPRIVFAMANDGLLYKFMGEINSKYKTPFNGTLLTGTLTGLLAAIFNLNQLINMMSIGTLLAYSMVASCVLILRYETDEKRDNRNVSNGRLVVDPNDVNCGLVRTLFNIKGSVVATKKTARIVATMTTSFVLAGMLFSYLLLDFENDFENVNMFQTIALIGTGITLFLMLYIISRQPRSGTVLAFKVPFVPWLPGLSILINVYLMVRLDLLTWVRLGVWILIGLLIFFTYGMRNSRLRQRGQRNSIANVREMSEISETLDDNKSETPLILTQNTNC